MSTIKNADEQIVPVRESRRSSGTIAALNHEVVQPVDGDQFTLVTVVSSLFVGTLEFTVAPDDGNTLYDPAIALPLALGAVGGTIPVTGSGVLTQAFVVADVKRQFLVPCARRTAVRVRCSAFTSGNCIVHLTSDVNPAAFDVDGGSQTLTVTQTAAVNTIVTCSLPAVPGLRHCISSIRIERFATALLTAGAAPVIVTTTNLPGTPAYNVPADAAAQGSLYEKVITFDPPLNATALGTATTIVFPATPNVIARVTATYRLGP
jgi:hypothetical protein